MKPLAFIKRSNGSHWVGDGFPVKNIFSYQDIATEMSPFLLMDYAGPTEFPPTEQRLGVGQHPHRGFETVTIVYEGEVEHREDDESFEVEVASTGQVVRVQPDQTVVKALESIGVCVQMSCEQGVCGTCLTRVISGQPDHRDMYLTEEEQAANDQFLPCCSRAKSGRLVLDL